MTDDDFRYLRKWLNEEVTAPIDRVALATALNEITELRRQVAEQAELIELQRKMITDGMEEAALIEKLAEALKMYSNPRSFDVAEKYYFEALAAYKQYQKRR